jgi:hypothetical protein
VEKRERRRAKYSAAKVEGWIARIDGRLKRFRQELPKSDLKLADYMRLAEMETLAADGGEGEVIVRWVNADEVKEMEADEDL